jgi:hypothetical protein
MRRTASDLKIRLRRWENTSSPLALVLMSPTVIGPVWRQAIDELDGSTNQFPFDSRSIRPRLLASNQSEPRCVNGQHTNSRQPEHVLIVLIWSSEQQTVYGFSPSHCGLHNTFVSSNPPEPASQYGLRCRGRRCLVRADAQQSSTGLVHRFRETHHICRIHLFRRPVRPDVLVTLLRRWREGSFLGLRE